MRLEPTTTNPAGAFSPFRISPRLRKEEFTRRLESGSGALSPLIGAILSERNERKSLSTIPNRFGAVSI